MKFKTILLLILFGYKVTAQENGIKDLRNNYLPNTYINKNCLSIKDSLNRLNYTRLLLNSWKCLDGNSVLNNDWATLCQAFSFVGDNKSVVNTSVNHMQNSAQLEILNDTNFVNSVKENKIEFKSASTLILEEFKKTSVIMFNEAHDRVQTRAYFLSLLKDLKSAGATFLAMETLNENGNLKSLDGTTGYYSAEPVCGQIIREAIKLGYKLIPYEDTLGYKHTNNERDSIQARNLYNRIKTKNGVEKTVVLAGYGHIAEGTFNPDFRCMGMYFKTISQIDPLTVNQCEFIEESYMSTLSSKIIDKIYHPDSVFAITKDYIKAVIFNDPIFDIYIYHPQTQYINNRPNWLLTSKKVISEVIIPDKIKPVLIQAYMKCEIKNDDDYYKKVPYDQTFYSSDNKAYLILEKKNKYKIVFRNSSNEIISTLEYQSN